MSKKNKKWLQRQIGFETQQDDFYDTKEVKFPGYTFRIDEKKDAKFSFEGRVVMSRGLYHKLFSYVKNIKTEISGLGMVSCPAGANAIYITDIFIVKQTSSSGSTQIDNKDLAQKTMDLLKEYDAGDKSKNPENMKLWWHSHASSGVFWSRTDDTCCDAYANNSFLISMVANHAKELRCRIDIFSPIRITLDHIPVEIEESINYLEELEQKCKEEIMEKVKDAKESRNNASDFVTSYYENKPILFDGWETIDKLGFTWRWDVREQGYHPTRYGKTLTEKEYGAVADRIESEELKEAKNKWEEHKQKLQTRNT